MFESCCIGVYGHFKPRYLTILLSFLQYSMVDLVGCDDTVVLCIHGRLLCTYTPSTGEVSLLLLGSIKDTDGAVLEMSHSMSMSMSMDVSNSNPNSKATGRNASPNSIPDSAYKLNSNVTTTAAADSSYLYKSPYAVNANSRDGTPRFSQYNHTDISSGGSCGGRSGTGSGNRGVAAAGVEGFWSISQSGVTAGADASNAYNANDAALHSLLGSSSSSSSSSSAATPVNQCSSNTNLYGAGVPLVRSASLGASSGIRAQPMLYSRGNSASGGSSNNSNSAYHIRKKRAAAAGVGSSRSGSGSGGVSPTYRGSNADASDRLHVTSGATVATPLTTTAVDRGGVAAAAEVHNFQFSEADLAKAEQQKSFLLHNNNHHASPAATAIAAAAHNTANVDSNGVPLPSPEVCMRLVAKAALPPLAAAGAGGARAGAGAGALTASFSGDFDAVVSLKYYL